MIIFDFGCFLFIDDQWHHNMACVSFLHFILKSWALPARKFPHNFLNFVTEIKLSRLWIKVDARSEFSLTGRWRKFMILK